MQLNRKWAFLAFGVVFAFLATACDDSGDTTAASTTRPTTPPATYQGTYTGTVPGSADYVGIVVGPGGDALAYVCDSGDSVDWVNGRLAGGRASLVNDGGATLDVQFTGHRASGTFKRPDSPPLRFTATPAGEPAGVYRAAASFADGDYLGGWVVLPDGTQRGAVRRYETPLPRDGAGFLLDLAHPTVTVPGGILTATRVDPQTPLP